MLAVIGGSPRRFKPLIELYHRALKSNGHAIQPVGIHSPGFIAETDREAKELFWPLFKLHHERVGRTRGWPNITREQFEQEISQGSLYVGSPETVAQKMAATIRMLDIERFDIVYGFGPTMVGDRERMIELYGGEVIPRVRALLGEE
jgi:alkanesulfonate monooxygenase SsuD/methylene tetrahydromethanopterin reductase-like flavin-dependent oxidoreductase (luciferase family)